MFLDAEADLGTIELSIQYDPDANSLHVSLHRATVSIA
jgi:hypothetical protein